MAATTFTLFYDLPAELRRQIWYESIGPRIVEVRWASEEGFTFHPSVTPLLKVCAESCIVVLEKYRSSIIERNGTTLDGFDFKTDILYFPYPFPCSTSYAMSFESFLGSRQLNNQHKIRHLAFSMPPIPSYSEELEQFEDDPDDIGEKNALFFKMIQAKARRSSPLFLETLTLVFGDMPRTCADGDLEDFTKEEGDDAEIWRRRCLRSENMLREPHDPWQRSYRDARHLSRPETSWGSDVEVLIRHVSRRPGPNPFLW